MGTINEVVLLLREEFVDLKRVWSSVHFTGTVSGGRGFHKGGETSQHWGPVYASLPASKGGQDPHGPHDYS